MYLISYSRTSVECDLDGRFSHIRSEETNLGNLVTDIMRKATRSDVALINSGTFRSNSIHQTGTFSVKVQVSHLLNHIAVLHSGIQCTVYQQ